MGNSSAKEKLFARLEHPAIGDAVTFQEFTSFLKANPEWINGFHTDGRSLFELCCDRRYWSCVRHLVSLGCTFTIPRHFSYYVPECLDGLKMLRSYIQSDLVAFFPQTMATIIQSYLFSHRLDYSVAFMKLLHLLRSQDIPARIVEILEKQSFNPAVFEHLNVDKWCDEIQATFHLTKITEVQKAHLKMCQDMWARNDSSIHDFPSHTYFDW